MKKETLKKLQEIQEYAFNVLREYPLDRAAANVIAALGNASNRDRIELLDYYKDESAMKIYYDLVASGTVEQLLETIGFLDYINRQKRDALMTNLEKEIKELIEDVYAEELKKQPWEDVADMLDFWRDKDGDLLIESRGMRPVDGVDYVAYADNGVIWER